MMTFKIRFVMQLKDKLHFIIFDFVYDLQWVLQKRNGMSDIDTDGIWWDDLQLDLVWTSRITILFDSTYGNGQLNNYGLKEIEFYGQTSKCNSIMISSMPCYYYFALGGGGRVLVVIFTCTLCQRKGILTLYVCPQVGIRQLQEFERLMVIVLKGWDFIGTSFMV